MSRRKTPCIECRTRRRKCVWHLNLSSCLRCSQRAIECIQVDEDNGNESDTRGVEQQLEQWKYHVDTMETQLQQMETSMSQLIRAETNRREEPTWHLSIHQGVLQLDSRIESVEEAQQFNHAFFRYLSPFCSLFERGPILFESTTSHILIKSMMLITNFDMPQQPSYSIQKMLAHIGYNTIDWHSMVHQIVHDYMDVDRFHFIRTLHIPTLRTRLNNTKDPFTCPLIMAICVSMVASGLSCKQSTPIERRMLADFFYDKCNDALFEIFDDPTRQLDTIASIPLLYHYLVMVRLQFKQARHLATIALLIANELSFSDDKSRHLSTIERVMVDRQRFQSAYLVYNLQFIMDGKLKEDALERTPFQVRFEALDDEPHYVHLMINAANHTLRLFTTHYSLLLLQQMKRLYAKKETDLDPHIFLRYETVVREWWSSLPDDLRPCKDPFLFQFKDVDVLPKGSYRLLPFVMVHVMTMMLHSVLLKPRESMSGDSRGAFLGVLRQHALSMTMRSCGILLHLFRYVDLFGDNGDSLSFIFLGQIIYTLSCIKSCSEARLTQQLEDDFEKLFEQFIACVPPDHNIPSDMSPITTAISTNTLSPTLGIYNDYALSGYALYYDILRSSVAQLQTIP
ncbi:related to pex14-peroxisomal protein involved inprotein import-peroxin [Lichtheimia corymbifera JMRC:FSU:9682]|uniref:Related to pex14-peroxisomal protein involved inprotein import-peroxin n=1 Tax=Lichtheimia corymbifera JMRC:FSU:9682 TaxID=1263082 RepID=A0A068S9R4_9FUNG|nr:related to pex14-peroxisomal protein involved inprotein import-peroxin [Lichtheimia corymbifera JMRC:FSU:9682]